MAYCKRHSRAPLLNLARAAVLGANGTIKIGTQFFGTNDVLGNSNQIVLAIAGFADKSIMAYLGNVLGGAMGGQMTGSKPTCGSVQGKWYAHELILYAAEEKNTALKNSLRFSSAKIDGLPTLLFPK